MEQKAEKIEQEQLEQERIKQEQEKKENEARQLSTKIFTTKQNAIGKNIEDVKKELAELGVSDIPIKYISSKYYPIGTVAFVERDGENFTLNTFYVIESNKSEDLTIMPELKINKSEITKENVTEIQEQLIEIFETYELKCKFEINTKKNQNKNEKMLSNVLVTPPGEGKHYPKGATFIFIITVYE